MREIGVVLRTLAHLRHAYNGRGDVLFLRGPKTGGAGGSQHRQRFRCPRGPGAAGESSDFREQNEVENEVICEDPEWEPIRLFHWCFLSLKLEITDCQTTLGCFEAAGMSRCRFVPRPRRRSRELEPGTGKAERKLPHLLSPRNVTVRSRHRVPTALRSASEALFSDRPSIFTSLRLL